MVRLSRWASALVLAATAHAQTWTDCNPMNKTCPPDTALGVSNYSINLIKDVPSTRVWTRTAGSIGSTDNGATFVVNRQGDAPTVQSKFHIFFGTVEVIMRAAAGQGIVSSIVLQSDDLDEIDWEWIGGNNSYVQTNYFGKGNTTTYDRAIWHPVKNVQGDFHNYTTDWSPEKIDFYIDGNVVRTLKYGEANGGHNFPQTPCDVRLGIWAGGQQGNNNYTVEWAGGATDFSKAPFVMTVQSVRVSDASTGNSQYVWTDRSGSYQSIKSQNTTSMLVLDGNNGPSDGQTASQKWRGLSTSAKIGIVAGVLGVLAVIIIVFMVCCIKQRRAGKHERLLEDAKWDKERAAMIAYRAQMNRERNEKMGMTRGQAYEVVPNHHAVPPQGNTMYSMGQAGAFVQPPNGSVRSAPYAYSAHSTNSLASTGRGYQRF